MITSKGFLICITMLSLRGIAYSQHVGFKKLKIGNHLFSQNIFSSYKVSVYETDSMLFHLKSLDTEFICDAVVDYLDVKINKDSTIDFIHLFTKEVIVRDLEEYNKKYMEDINCIVNTVGKANYFDAGTNRIDGKTTVAWLFKNGIVMVFYSHSLALDERNVKRRYKFAWFKESAPKKMW